MIRRSIFIIVLTMVLFSCGNDDGNDFEVVPPRLLSEVAAEDDAEIKEFLASHFYNYEEFQSPPADFDFKIRIDTIAGENADKTPLSEMPELMSAVVTVSSNQFNLAEEETDVPHTYYYLSAREGEGLSPTVADSTLFRYEGMLLNGNKFDASPTYTWQQLPFLVRGFANGVSNFKSGTESGLVVNPDGTSFYTDSGIGLIIMPSGLGYFLGAGPSGSIPNYSNLIFTVDVGHLIVDTDDDGDGIPSIMEDLNGNGYLFDDNTDAESEANANVRPTADFQDPDDDDDGILTRDEIEIDEMGNITFPDSDNDGIPDYRDSDS
ncbi:FKBP-type peptidyl-prolyl cis-trans isomerase [Allomuricauda sp. SCSIO 65647]|uniref:FKBP-type peptidyl-prolyl cis-trans isomerase n=1 Tax=Allomuricauda sp. SCSIO 65647 TaxID=2908843 RepID=UPI001F3FA3A2|nr:hypothetical protein [Muricauda sp. SCSIO 65647]UJH67971.1 hypothetical protein L0P89_01850 [Muricauda sp. SCSIO 65647]